MSRAIQVDVLLELLGTLESFSTLSLKKLSEQIEVDPEELRSNLSLLSEINIGLDYIDVRVEGDVVSVGMLPVAVRKVLEFNNNQMLAFMLALRMSGVPSDSELYQKLSLGLSSEWGVDFVENYFTIVGPAHSFEVFKTLAIGLRNSIPVQISYQNSAGILSSRKIDIAQMSIEREGWYVMGHDHNAKAVRTFKLSNIFDAYLLDLDRSKASDNTGLPEASSDFVFSEERNASEATVRFKSRGDYSTRDWPFAKSEKTRIDGAIDIRIDVVNKSWLANQIIELGGRAEVISPLGLRRYVADCAHERLEKYRTLFSD